MWPAQARPDNALAEVATGVDPGGDGWESNGLPMTWDPTVLVRMPALIGHTQCPKLRKLCAQPLTQQVRDCAGFVNDDRCEIGEFRLVQAAGKSRYTD